MAAISSFHYEDTRSQPLVIVLPGAGYEISYEYGAIRSLMHTYEEAKLKYKPRPSAYVLGCSAGAIIAYLCARADWEPTKIKAAMKQITTGSQISSWCCCTCCSILTAICCRKPSMFNFGSTLTMDMFKKADCSIEPNLELNYHNIVGTYDISSGTQYLHRLETKDTTPDVFMIPKVKGNPTREWIKSITDSEVGSYVYFPGTLDKYFNVTTSFEDTKYSGSLSVIKASASILSITPPISITARKELTSRSQSDGAAYSANLSTYMESIFTSVCCLEAKDLVKHLTLNPFHVDFICPDDMKVPIYFKPLTSPASVGESLALLISSLNAQSKRNGFTTMYRIYETITRELIEELKYDHKTVISNISVNKTTETLSTLISKRGECLASFLLIFPTDGVAVDINPFDIPKFSEGQLEERGVRTTYTVYYNYIAKP